MDGVAPLFELRRELNIFFDRYIYSGLKNKIHKQLYFSDYEKERILTYLESLIKKRIYRSIEILQILKISGKHTKMQGPILLLNSPWQSSLFDFYKENGHRVYFYNLFIPCLLQKRDSYIMDAYVVASIGHKY